MSLRHWRVSVSAHSRVGEFAKTGTGDDTIGQAVRKGIRKGYDKVHVIKSIKLELRILVLGADSGITDDH